MSTIDGRGNKDLRQSGAGRRQGGGRAASEARATPAREMRGNDGAPGTSRRNRGDNSHGTEIDHVMRYTLFATCSALFTVIVLTSLSRWVPNAATVQIAIGAVGTIMTSAFGVTALHLRRDRRR